MAIYERRSGAHVAERVQPVPGSDSEAAYAALAEDPGTGWRIIEQPKSKRQAKTTEKEES